MMQEFKKFIMRGNVIDMAIGIVIGVAFTTVVNSFVNDILMPPIGVLLGNVDFSDMYLLLQQGDPAGPYASLADAQAAGAVTLAYGAFINTLISFLIIAFAIFMLIRVLNMFHKEEEKPEPGPTTKDCPVCFTSIPIKATRCPNCTSQLD